MLTWARGASFPELVEQLGIMRFGHRPRVADTFCGSGQIPFEAARLGCDVYASDLNPVACMLTWGAFNIVGGSRESREKIGEEQEELVAPGSGRDRPAWRRDRRRRLAGEGLSLLRGSPVSADRLDCSAAANSRCEQGLSSRRGARARPQNRRYDIRIRTGVSEAELAAAETGTVRREGKYGEAYLVHKSMAANTRQKSRPFEATTKKADGTIATVCECGRRTTSCLAPTTSSRNDSTASSGCARRRRARRRVRVPSGDRGGPRAGAYRRGVRRDT